MQQISISDVAYETLKAIATKHSKTMQEIVEEIAAQQAWEEHAAENYDLHEERATRGEKEKVLTEEEFFQHLEDVGTPQ